MIVKEIIKMDYYDMDVVWSEDSNSIETYCRVCYNEWYVDTKIGMMKISDPYIANKLEELFQKNLEKIDGHI